ncbi:partial Methyl-accepting chemotaxis protein McpS, partial [Planctomycetaceae bacterium]
MKWFNDLSIATKLIGSYVFVALIAALVGYFGYQGISVLADNQDELYQQRLLPIADLGAANAALLTARGDVRNVFMSRTPEARTKYIGIVRAESKKVDDLVAKYASGHLTPEETGILESFHAHWKTYSGVRDRALEMAMNGEEVKALAMIDGPAREELTASRKALTTLVEVNTRMADEVDKATDVQVRSSETLLLIVIILAMAIALGLGVFLARVIGLPIKRTAEAAAKLATGDVDRQIPNGTSKDEIGMLGKAFTTLVANTKEQAAAAHQISEGNLSVEITPRSREDVLGTALRQAVVALRGLVTEAGMLSKAAVDGKLATRGNAEKFQGGYREIVQGVNDTLDAVIGPLNVAAEYVDRISKGDIPAKISDTYNGDFNEIKNNLNQAIGAVNALVADAVMLSQAAVEGKLATRADASKHGGDFRKIVQGVNATLDSLVGFIDSMPVPAMIIDRDRTIQYMNTIGAAVGDRTPAALLGSKCYDHFHTDHCTSGECACLRALSTGNTEHGETTARPGKNQLEIAYTGVPIRNDRKEMVGVLEIVVDQTSVKRAQAVADKVAGYQKAQVEGLSGDLQKLSIGDLHLALAVAPADADTAEVRKNFEAINERLGGARQAVANLVADAVMLSQAAVDGRLATRADASKHQGDFRKIVQGVNETLDAVIKPVQEGSNTLAVMATGDMTARMQGDYRGDLQLIKESINKVGESLEEALQKVSSAVGATASASSQISSSTEEMAAGAQEQTSQAGEVASAVEEMTKTIMENSKNASVAADTAKQAKERAELGGKVVDETVEGMRRIADVVNKSAETVRELG